MIVTPSAAQRAAHAAGHRLRRPRARCEVGGVGAVDVVGVRARDHEHVAVGGRGDVEKRDRALVLVDALGRHGPGRDAAEDAVAHGAEGYGAAAPARPRACGSRSRAARSGTRRPRRPRMRATGPRRRAAGRRTARARCPRSGTTPNTLVAPPRFSGTASTASVLRPVQSSTEPAPASVQSAASCQG